MQVPVLTKKANSPKSSQLQNATTSMQIQECSMHVQKTCCRNQHLHTRTCIWFTFFFCLHKTKDEEMSEMNCTERPFTRVHPTTKCFTTDVAYILHSRNCRNQSFPDVTHAHLVLLWKITNRKLHRGAESNPHWQKNLHCTQPCVRADSLQRTFNAEHKAAGAKATSWYGLGLTEMI